ncbi:MAG: Ig-like domain-containing protein [Treponematales bacterium]
MSIAVTTQPTKTAYTVGEAFDSTGLVVTAYYDDGSQKAVTDHTLSPANGAVLTTAGTQTVTVTYDGKTASFYLTVFAQAASLTNNQWTTGNIAAGGEDWYSFTAAAGKSYGVQWADSFDYGTYTPAPTGDIVVAGCRSSDRTATLFPQTDYGYSSPQTISGYAGTVYLKVVPYYGGAGTYAIKYWELPALTGTVTITGDTWEGGTLTAEADLDGSGTVSYQWKRADTSGGEYSDIASATDFTYTSVAADLGKYIKVVVTMSGNSGAVTSAAVGPVTAAVNWTAVTDTGLTDAFGGHGSIRAITYGGAAGQEKFVAVGLGYNGSTYYGKAAYSADGVNWTAVTDTGLTDAFGSNGYILAITYGGGKFVAVGDSGKAAYSADGVTWTAVTDTGLTNASALAITYGGGKFVAVGDSGKAAYSADGVTWAAVSDTKFGTGDGITAIAYGGNKFVAVGTYDQAAYSTDGINWTAVSDTKFGTGDGITAIAYGGNKFVAVGTYDQAAYSTDGVTWTAVADTTFGSRGDDRIWGIAYGGGKFVAVGQAYDNYTAYGNAAYWDGQE